MKQPKIPWNGNMRNLEKKKKLSHETMPVSFIYLLKFYTDHDIKIGLQNSERGTLVQLTVHLTQQINKLTLCLPLCFHAVAIFGQWMHLNDPFPCEPTDERRTNCQQQKMLHNIIHPLKQFVDEV